jgi:hypothetical protein
MRTLRAADLAGLKACTTSDFATLIFSADFATLILQR